MAKVTGMLRGGAGGIMMVDTLLGVTGTGGQRRDLTFKSPESLRPRTFLLDLNKEITIQSQLKSRQGINRKHKHVAESVQKII